MLNCLRRQNDRDTDEVLRFRPWGILTFQPLAIHYLGVAEILVVDLEKVMILLVVEVQRPSGRLPHRQRREQSIPVRR